MALQLPLETEHEPVHDLESRPINNDTKEHDRSSVHSIHDMKDDSQHETLSEKGETSSATIDEPTTSAKPEESEYPDGGLRAWLIVAGVAATTCATFGFTNSWGVFQGLYEHDRLRDQSPSTIAWIGSAQYALVFFPGLVAGRMFDIGHFRVPLFFWSVVMVLSCFLIAECRVYWQYLLVQGLMVGLACGFLFNPVLAVMTHWFKRRRSLAFGVSAIGSSVGGTVFPILARSLEKSLGFKWALRIIGVIIFALLAFANIVLRRRLPPVKTSGGLFNPKAFKNPAYTIYVASTFIAFLGIYAVLTYIDVGAVSHGISPDFSFYLIAIANASSGVGRLAAGLVGDKLGAINTMVPTMFVAAIMTVAWPFATTVVSTIIVALIYGFACGTFVSLIVIPTAHMGEISDVGRRTGMQGTILAIGALAGPPASGAIATAAGSYVPLGIFAGAVVIISCCLMLATKRLHTGHWIHARF